MHEIVNGEMVFILPAYDLPPYGDWLTNAASDSTLEMYQGKPGYKLGPPSPHPCQTVAGLEKAGICGVYRSVEVDEPTIVESKVQKKT